MIIDTNVALGWFLPEQQSEAKDRLLVRDDLAAPELIDIEFAGILTKRTRQMRISTPEAEAIWHEWSAMPVRKVACDSLLDRAFDLSLHLRAGFADCIFLALAIAKDDVLASGDHRFVRAVRSDRTLAHVISPLAAP